MACSCHGTKGVYVEATAPTDQCTTCALKHIDKAYAAFNEFNYREPNRRFIRSQLRLAVDHLMYDHHDLALKVRDLAIIIEEVRDKEITTEWDVICNDVSDAFYKDHPDVLQRLQDLSS